MQFLKVGYVIGGAIFVLWTMVMPGVVAVSAALHFLVRWNLVAWPPRNTTFSTFFFGRRRQPSRRSMKKAQVRHAYSRATV